MKTLRFTLVLGITIGICLLINPQAIQGQKKPRDMVLVPAGPYDFQVEYRWREGLTLDSLIVDDLGKRYRYSQSLSLQSFYIDRTEVTNEQFKAFLDASGYKPEWPKNFLKHWINGNFPEGKANHPVVWVSLKDAQAYCEYYEKRLPDEEEWQKAAQDRDEAGGGPFQGVRCRQRSVLCQA